MKLPEVDADDIVQDPEKVIARDIARRGLMIAPVLVVVGAIFWGVEGAISTGFALALVIINFLVAAAIMSWAAKISPPVLMAAAMGGFVLRLAIITVAVLAVKDRAWVAIVPLGLTIIVAHLYLLIWESSHVSASLAYPALKPTSGGPRKETKHL